MKILVPVLAAVLATLTTGAFGMTPSLLRCENRIAPLGVEAAASRLPWQLQAGTDEINQFQSAYQILVASSEANLSADNGDLTFVNTHHDGPYGRIVSNWRKENGQFILETTIPPNSTATVVLPDGSCHEIGSGSRKFTVTLPAPPRTGQILLEDNFNSVSQSAVGFNATLEADQQGTLAPLTYSVTTTGQDWQAQHGNGAVMLLVGDAGYGATASLNRDFAATANEADLPLSIQFETWVTDTPNTGCWSSVCFGSAKNITANDRRAKFGILPVLDGTMQVWMNGVQQPVASNAGNNFRIVFSNTAGTGSAFNGHGSQATIYNGSTVIGSYTLPQLTAGDSYLSFAANPYNGSWNITHIDNRQIALFSDYDTWSASLGLTGGAADDDELDGVSNHAKYAFGLDPKSGGSTQPHLGFPAPPNGTFSYTRRKRSLSGMDFSVWTSTNLTDWAEDTGAGQTITGTSGDVETVQVTLGESALNHPKLFVRIRAN